VDTNGKDVQSSAVIKTVSDPARPLKVRLATIARSLVILAVFSVITVCYFAEAVIAPVLLALLISLLLSPVVGIAQRLRLPRPLASGLVVLLSVTLSVAAIFALAQPARDWLSKAPTTIKSVQQRLNQWRGPVQDAKKASATIEGLTKPDAPGQEVVVREPSLGFGGILSNTSKAAEAIAIVVLLVFFFLSSGDNFLRRLVEVAPTMNEKRTVVSIARDIEREMSRYLLTITTINFGLGCATAVACALLQIPNALLWGALAFVLNFAPYVGAAITGITLALVGFSTFDSLTHALLVPGAFFLLAFIEGQLVTPTIIGRRLALYPVVVFVWLLVWGALWGIIGVLLAGPLLACFRIVCQHTEALRPIYVLIGDVRLDEEAA
jgi:predicted PurR-regulated permease PerM